MAPSLECSETLIFIDIHTIYTQSDERKTLWKAESEPATRTTLALNNARMPIYCYVAWNRSWYQLPEICDRQARSMRRARISLIGQIQARIAAMRRAGTHLFRSSTKLPRSSSRDILGLWLPTRDDHFQQYHGRKQRSSREMKPEERNRRIKRRRKIRYVGVLGLSDYLVSLFDILYNTYVFL